MTEDRRKFVIGAEGAALAMVQQAGPDGAAEHIRCHIDGWVNALIRIEGAEAVSRYTFALADRVVAGLREPTEFHLLAVPVAVVAIEEPKPATQKLDHFAYWWGYVSGFIVGTAAGVILYAARS